MRVVPSATALGTAIKVLVVRTTLVSVVSSKMVFLDRLDHY
jgi:hypothetical protein